MKLQWRNLNFEVKQLQWNLSFFIKLKKNLLYGFPVNFSKLIRIATLQNSLAPTASEKYSNIFSCLAFPYLWDTRCAELFHYSHFFLELRLTFCTNIKPWDKINVLLHEEGMQDTTIALQVCAASNTAVHKWKWYFYDENGEKIVFLKRKL